MSYKLDFFYENKLYKNNEVENVEQIRANFEHFEAGKFKNKNNKITVIYKSRRMNL